MEWQIAYFSEKVERDVLRLPKKLQARYFRMLDVMVEFGPDLGMPHTKSMGDGLFELRLKAQEGIARVFYCTVVNRQIVLLHSIIKKTQKTPAKDLQIAKLRLKEVKENG